MTTYPAAIQHPVQNHGGTMSSHLGLVLHVQQGNNSLAGYFNNPASQVSSTFWVAKAGTVEQYVDANVVAWAQAQGNATYNSVETEGYDTEPLTSAQVSALADLYRWGHTTYAWPYVLSGKVGDKGFAWHGMGGSAWGNHPGCPGDLRKSQMQTILDEASGTVTPPQPTPPKPTPSPPKPTPTFPPFPYPATDYLGQPSPDPHCHSGYYGGVDQANVSTWQTKMRQRGWAITADGMYGPQSSTVCRQFQAEKHLSVDGLVGPQTWTTTWTAPVT